MKELGYNPMTIGEAFRKSIKEHVESGAVPSLRTVRMYQFIILSVLMGFISFIIFRR